ncbi:hypothetical protein GCM10009799_41090 [Nocardiopsis rhodophaea]|uniref:Uncharacterized protein n=1 Tax=Nocardiopsis rhodophaea TaxID=280238 RepID=A0ABP5EZ63_9ACTN
MALTARAARILHFPHGVDELEDPTSARVRDAADVNLFRHAYETLRPTRPSANAHHVRFTSPSNTAVSVWPLADPPRDWEVPT